MPQAAFLDVLLQRRLFAGVPRDVRHRHRRSDRRDGDQARAGGISGPVGQHAVAPRGPRIRSVTPGDEGPGGRLPADPTTAAVTEQTLALITEAAAQFSDLELMTILRFWGELLVSVENGEYWRRRAPSSKAAQCPLGFNQPHHHHDGRDPAGDGRGILTATLWPPWSVPGPPLRLKRVARNASQRPAERL